MPFRFEKAVFVFRRDLRLDDNTGLLAALESSREVIPIFIYDPRQVGQANRYRGEHSLQFMAESLEDLARQLARMRARLHCFQGLPHEVTDGLIRTAGIDAVFTNRDYTPFSLKRDAEMRRICSRHGVPLHQYDDYLLTTPEQVRKRDGSPYTIFTPFFRAASALPVASPRMNKHGNYGSTNSGLIGDIRATSLTIASTHRTPIGGGRTYGLRQIKRVASLTDYERDRDIPAKEATSALSSHLKFGTVSVREMYSSIRSRLGPDYPLIRQLYWRDFFGHIAFHFPHVFGRAFHAKYDKIRWRNSRRLFRLWCEGKTGVPIVDAGMRQLSETGAMHNRVRMITASFLVKDLHIDWRWGERHFAQRLADYDPAVNNGNWQWVASTGCDAVPYFRVFNPWLQQKRFDPDCIYVKRWVPELGSASAEQIHALEHRESVPVSQYPRPITDHRIAARITQQVYKETSERHRR